MKKRRLLLFTQDEVYYWEPFYQILSEELQIANVCVERVPKREFDINFRINRRSRLDGFCEKIYLPNNKVGKYFRTLKLIYTHRKENIMICQYIKTFNIFCLLISKLCFCKVHFKGEGILLENEKIKFAKFIYLKIFLGLCNEVYYSCSGNKNLFRKVLPNKVLNPLLCFCGYIDPKYKKTQADFGKNDICNIVLCGSFIAIKNFEIISVALKNAQYLCKNVHIHTIGSGPTLQSLTEELIRLKVKYTNHGYVEPEQVPALFKKVGDVLFLPSRRDNSPKVVNEAMVVGLPILISENCGTTTDLITDGWNGFTFHPDDVNKVAYSIERLVNNSELKARMGMRSRQKVRDFSAENAVKTLVSKLR